MGVVVPLEKLSDQGLGALAGLVAADMDRVNAMILSRTGSEVAMIPEVANHLISSGGKRLRPMLTLATAELCGHRGEGHVKLAASVEFMHTATLLHDDVVDGSEMRRGKLAARMLWGNEASVLVGDFLLGQAFKMMVEVGSLHALDVLSTAAAVIAEGEVMQLSAAKNTATTEDEYLAVVRGKTAALFACGMRSWPHHRRARAGRAGGLPELQDEISALPFSSSTMRWIMVARAPRWARRSATISEKAESPSPSCCRSGAVRRRTSALSGSARLKRARSPSGDLEQAVGIMRKHRAIEDTIERARHYGAMARDTLALFPNDEMKDALIEAVDFCIARTH